MELSCTHQLQLLAATLCCFTAFGQRTFAVDNDGHGASAQRFCRVTTLSSLEGSFAGQGTSEYKLDIESGNYFADCAWFIEPSMQLLEIQFFKSGESHFEDKDYLAMYGAHNYQAHQVGSFDAEHNLPQAMSLQGSNSALIVLNAWSNMSRFEMNYVCKPYGTQIGNTWFSPSGYAFVMASAVIAALVLAVTALYILVYCKARRQRDTAISESEVVVMAELSRRRHAAEANEQRVTASLKALPVERYKPSESDVEGDEEAANQEECCLCLEPFKEDEMLRVLPCQHLFHQSCVDKWFEARRFLPRSCPLCKRNPVQPQTLTTPRGQEAVPSVETHAPNNSLQATSRAESDEEAPDMEASHEAESTAARSQQGVQAETTVIGRSLPVAV